MVAAVVAGRKRGIEISVNGCLAVIKVGKRVGRKRVERALKPFGRDFIVSDGVVSSEFGGVSGEKFAEKLLFRVFFRYIKSVGAGRVGIFDPDGSFLPEAVRLLDSVKELSAVTNAADEGILGECIRSYGTCIEVCAEKALFECEVCFCPKGLSGFEGVLFGLGGITVCGDGLELPEFCTDAVNSGADPLKLGALLELEKSVGLDSLLPRFAFIGDERVSVDSLLCGKVCPKR